MRATRDTVGYAPVIRAKAIAWTGSATCGLHGAEDIALRR